MKKRRLASSDLNPYTIRIFQEKRIPTGITFTAALSSAPDGPEYVADEAYNREHNFDSSNEYRWTDAGMSLEKANEEVLKAATNYLKSRYSNMTSFNVSKHNLTDWSYSGFRTKQGLALKIDVIFEFTNQGEPLAPEKKDDSSGGGGLAGLANRTLSRLIYSHMKDTSM